jgi:ferredoxin
MDPKIFEQMYEENKKKLEDEVKTLDPGVQRILGGPESKITVDTSPYLQKIARDRREIHIDPGRCTEPGLCLKCQKACSYKVFAYIWHPAMPFGPFSEIVKRQGRMVANYPDLCTHCGQCAEACPQKAITIKAAEQGITSPVA